MLRRVKLGLVALVSILCLGLADSASAGGVFEDRFVDREDILEELILEERIFGRGPGVGLGLGLGRGNPFLDREDLLTELILRQRLFGRGFGRGDLLLEAILLEELIDEAFEDRFERDELLDIDDFFELDDEDEDDDD